MKRMLPKRTSEEVWIEEVKDTAMVVVAVATFLLPAPEEANTFWQSGKFCWRRTKKAVRTGSGTTGRGRKGPGAVGPCLLLPRRRAW